MTRETGLTLFCDHDPCDCQAEYCHRETAIIAAQLFTALKSLIALADSYSDAMTKIGRGHSELGSESPSMTVSALAHALIARIEKRIK